MGRVRTTTNATDIVSNMQKILCFLDLDNHLKKCLSIFNIIASITKFSILIELPSQCSVQFLQHMKNTSEFFAQKKFSKESLISKLTPLSSNWKLCRKK